MTQPEPENMDYRERFRRISSLGNDKEAWIERWARELIRYPPLERFKLTARQRRVIASLKWTREMAKLTQGEDERLSGRPQEPPPIMGYDERDRIVVQQHAKGHPGNIRCWALGREGQPVDVRGNVRSLKDDRIVRRADA